MLNQLEQDMLAELKTCYTVFRHHSVYRGLSKSDQALAAIHANRVLRLITIATAPGLIKALPRNDQWAAYTSGSPGRPLTALCDGLGQVCLYETELAALQAASAALAGP